MRPEPRNPHLREMAQNQRWHPQRSRQRLSRGLRQPEEDLPQPGDLVLGRSRRPHQTARDGFGMTRPDPRACAGRVGDALSFRDVTVPAAQASGGASRRLRRAARSRRHRGHCAPLDARTRAWRFAHARSCRGMDGSLSSAGENRALRRGCKRRIVNKRCAACAMCRPLGCARSCAFSIGSTADSRDAAGTGSGRAPVRQLAEATGGSGDVANREPGPEPSVAVPVSHAEGTTPRRRRRCVCTAALRSFGVR
jgi:hypothetical protein